MRAPGLFVASFVAACSRPNPAFILTDSTGASWSDTSAPATGATDVAATDGTTTVDETSDGTLPVTSGPVTSGSGTSETGTGSTTGASSTTGAPVCSFADSPDLELTYTTSLMPDCNVTAPRQAHVEVLGQSGVNQWKFNVCGSELVCRDPQTPCENGEHIIITFDGPAELVPTFVTGECHQLHLLARANDPDDPTACKLRLLRIAHTRYSPYATHYVGATFVPGTAGLPGMVDWFSLLGFELVSKIDAPCIDELNCQPPVGDYVFDVQWGKPAVAHTVGEGQSFEEKFVTSVVGQNVEIHGTFTPIRARIEPGACGTGQQFKWVWLAQLPQP